MSDYRILSAQLASAVCPACHGFGYVDDAEPGDIGFNTYSCGDCDGSGFLRGERVLLIPADKEGE